MIVHRIHHKIRIILLSFLIEQLKEQRQGFLPKVVPKQLNRNQLLVQSQRLRNLLQPKVIYRVISHIQMNQRLILMNRLCHRLRSVVSSLITSQMQ